MNELGRRGGIANGLPIIHADSCHEPRAVADDDHLAEPRGPCARLEDRQHLHHHAIGSGTGGVRATRRWRIAVIAVIGGSAIALVLAVAAGQLPSAGAGGLLHPGRRRVMERPPPTCHDATFTGEGVRLQGWQCRASVVRRGTLIYLHGIADNRTSGSGVIDRFGRRGFDVVAYDGRAHGESDGDVCTYGFFEKDDLHRVLDSTAPGPIVLIGTSLGAAVALQEAAEDPRVTAGVAAETFSPLRTVGAERAPFFFTAAVTARASPLARPYG